MGIPQPVHYKWPCIIFVGCMFTCDQTNAPTDIFLVPLETLSQGQPIGTNYTSVGTLVWPQESKNSTAVFWVKYTVHGPMPSQLSQHPMQVGYGSCAELTRRALCVCTERPGTICRQQYQPLKKPAKFKCGPLCLVAFHVNCPSQLVVVVAFR